VPNDRRILTVLLVTAALAGPLHAQVTTTADFTRWSGDVDPLLFPGFFEVYVNDQLVPPGGQILGDYVQGEILLPGAESGVEFKNRQPGLPFNTPNLVAYTPHTSPAPLAPGEAFKLGTLSITNGIWFAQARVDVTFTTSSPLAAFNSLSFSDSLVYISTPNSNLLPDGDPDHAANADVVSFQHHPGLGTIHVYELSAGLGNVGSVELWGRIGSLEPAFLANPSGALFLLPVPEPATVWMWLGGGLIGWRLARRLRPGREKTA
jgi:hypothetical protein